MLQLQHFTFFAKINFGGVKMTKLFENISEKNILKLKKILKSSTLFYRKGVNVLSNVNLQDFIAIIDTGSVQLIYNDYNGNSTVLEELGEGEFFGSLTLNINSDDITCITKEETKITFIEYNEITNDEIIRTDFYIIFIKNLIKILNEQLHNKNNRIELLTKRSIRDKLIEYFTQEAQKTGRNKFKLAMTYTDLANYLSVDRSAMTRELKALKNEGFIETNNRMIKIYF